MKMRSVDQHIFTRMTNN